MDEMAANKHKIPSAVAHKQAFPGVGVKITIEVYNRLDTVEETGHWVTFERVVWVDAGWLLGEVLFSFEETLFRRQCTSSVFSKRALRTG